MRRGSLVGPLLIILIGVWFLVSSLRPELPMLDVAARFWPFVLIGWGALRLLEILVWAVRGRPLPYAGISGGEWTLIVFLCLIGSGLYAANRWRPWHRWGVFTSNRIEIFGHTYDYAVPEQKAPAGDAKRLLVENLRGNTRIIGDDGNEIIVGGRKTVRALQEDEAGKANDQTPVEISAQADQVVVRTNQDRVTGEQRVSTDLEITVPRAMSVEVRGRKGDVEARELKGGVEVSSDDGGVRLENIGANVRLDVRRSDLVRAAGVAGSVEVLGGRGRDVELENIGGEVTINGAYSGDLQFKNFARPLRVQTPQTDLRVEKLPGQLHLDLGELSGANLVGPIRFTTSRARDVQLEQFTQSLEMELDRGDISLRPVTLPVAKIQARTHAGQIELALPEAAKFELKASTTRGDLNNDFGPALKTEYEDSRRENAGGAIVGSTGQGAEIVLATDRGSVTVRKDTGAPLAPLAPHSPRPPRPPRGSITMSGPRGSIEIEKH